MREYAKIVRAAERQPDRDWGTAEVDAAAVSGGSNAIDPDNRDNCLSAGGILISSLSAGRSQPRSVRVIASPTRSTPMADFERRIPNKP